MEYQNFIKAELLILIPVLYILGMLFKKSKLPDKWIPLLLGAISVALTAIWTVATEDFANAKEVMYGIFTVLTQGILVAGSSVYANQIYVQAKKEE